MASRPLTIAVKDHLGKVMQFARALHDAGHRLVASGPAEVLLIDLDLPHFGYRQVIDYYKSMGATVVLYPHGPGNPILGYDGLWEPYEAVDANFVTGVGQAEYFRRIAYPTSVHVAGWTLCEQKPFRPRTAVREVVYAPTHPSGDGSMLRDRRELNGEIYAKLLDGPWHLSVRHVGTLEQNGLWEAEHVTYVQSNMRTDTTQIDAADVVVAGVGTYPALAVARGVPTVVYAQSGRPLSIGHKDDAQDVYARREHLYADYTRYPFDLEAGPADEVLHAAAAGGASLEHWRRRFIGDAFDSQTFVRHIERLAAHPTPAPLKLDDTRAFTVAAFADEVAERPELLATYVEAIGPHDDATLLLVAPGLEESQALGLAEHAISAASLDPERLPDILLVPSGAAPADLDAAVAARASAVLSEWPAIGPLAALDHFARGEGGRLRAAAKRGRLSPV